MKVGIVGLRKLGQAMAERLVDTGFDLRAWTRSRKDDAALGLIAGRTVDSLEALARHAEALVIVVREDAALTSLRERPLA